MAKMKRADAPKVIWGNRVNLVGLYSQKPIRMKLYDEYYDEDELWWTSTDGSLGVHEVGLVGSAADGCRTFSSESKREVELWTDGAMAVLQRLDNFASTGRK